MIVNKYLGLPIGKDVHNNNTPNLTFYLKKFYFNIFQLVTLLDIYIYINLLDIYRGEAKVEGHIKNLNISGRF